MPVIVITGATRGIGEAAVIELARQGAEIALVGPIPSAFTPSPRRPLRPAPVLSTATSRI